MITSGTLDLLLANALPEIHRLAEQVEDFCERHGLSPKIAYAFNLAFDEVLTNIISYAYDDAGPHPITVRLWLAHGVVSAEVIDDGRAFDPFQQAPPDTDAPIDERAIGGLGIFLVKEMMDTVAYRRENGANHLLLTKATSFSPRSGA